MMANFDLELAFVGQFAGYAVRKDIAAWNVLNTVQPGMLEHPELDQRFGVLSGRFAAGEHLSDPDDQADDLWFAIQDAGVGHLNLANLATRIRDDWRAREQLR